MRIIQLPPFQNVLADGVANCSLDIGHTYNRIRLELGGSAFVKSDITRIVGKINGKIFYDITGPHLDLINKYRGIADAATFLTLDFTEPNAKTLGGMYMGGIGTASGVGQGNFNLEVTIAGATVPTLKAIAEVGAPRPLGVILGMIPFTYSFAAAGRFPIEPPHGAGSPLKLKRVHFMSTLMTSLNVKKNGLDIYEEVSKANFEHHQKEFNKTPQAGLMVYDPIVNDDMARVVDLADAREFRMYTTISAAENITFYTETLGFLKNY